MRSGPDGFRVDRFYITIAYDGGNVGEADDGANRRKLNKPANM